MLLDRVVIKNFRSIPDATIHFQPKCRIFVGINESGKSNLLDALSFLGENKPKDEDVRQDVGDEGHIEESYVRFIFKLLKNDVDAITDSFNATVLSKKSSTNIFLHNKKNLTIKNLLGEIDEALYVSEVITKKKYASLWAGAIDVEEHEVISKWKKPSTNCPEDFAVTLEDGSEILLKSHTLIDSNDYPDIPEEHLSDASAAYIGKILWKAIVEHIDSTKPPCIYWKYDEKNILPDRIELEAFMAKPSTCVPLKNMFQLIDVDNINEYLTDQKARNPEYGISNALDKIADHTTKHIKTIWKDRKDKDAIKDISILLELDGGHIKASIRDKYNRFSFTKRSDGFKRLVTFLLLISSQVKTGNLENTLLLIDEPEISLHPGGAQSLRDELIQISVKNYVVYATHSIFMIDGEDTGRHLIVTKDGEKTNISVADDSNIIEEEVIFNALGCSMFYGLKDKNIIFEGWRDKRLFDIATKTWPREKLPLKATYDGMGKVFVRGVKDISNVAALIRLANKKTLIISDNDSPAKAKQKVYEKEHGDSNWLKYEDLIPESGVITGEDFIEESFCVKAMDEIRKEHTSIPAISEADFADDRGKLTFLKGELLKASITPEETEEIIEKFKTFLFDEPKRENIKPFYYDLLEELASRASQI